MAQQSVFRGVIDFFIVLGVYDVILPFILVFAIVFAILEKTKVFGTETFGDQEYTKKNINAMTAFVIAFLVIASGKLVAIINESLGNIVILLLVIVSFLILIGSFYKEDEDVFLEKGPWRLGFMIATLIGVILIFLHAIPTDDGNSNWLEASAKWISNHWDTNWVGSIFLMIVVIVLIYFTVKDNKPKIEQHKST